MGFPFCHGESHFLLQRPTDCIQMQLEIFTFAAFAEHLIDCWETEQHRFQPHVWV